jgi:glucokinase
VARAAFERGARALAAMIVSTAAAIEVTHVVIGGGVANAGPVLFDPLERAMDELAGFAFVRAVEIRRSKLGVQAALAGAAKLAWSSGVATAAPPPAPHDAR